MVEVPFSTCVEPSGKGARKGGVLLGVGPDNTKGGRGGKRKDVARENRHVVGEKWERTQEGPSDYFVREREKTN